MADFVIRPASDTDWQNARHLSGDLPLSSVSAAELGIVPGMDYEIGRIGELATFQVTGVAPAFAEPAVYSISGRTITITTGTATGYEAPTYSIVLTLDGTPVTPSGTGPWTYVVPEETFMQTVAWVVTATNALGSATSGGSELVPGIAAAIGSDPDLIISGGGLVNATDLTVRFRITDDPEGLTVTTRVAAIALLSNYTGNEQTAENWGTPGEEAAFVSSVPVNGEVELTVTTPGQYAMVWEAREADHATNPPDPRRWSDGSVASAQVWLDNAPAAMAAPTLAVGGDTITVTFPADPSSTAPITRYDIAYRPVGGSLTVVQGVTSGYEITGLATGDWEVAVAAANEPGGVGEFSNFASDTVVSGVDTVAPVANSLTMGAQAADGDVTLTVDTLSEAGTLGVVWTSTAPSGATSLQIRTAAEGGAPLSDQLSVATQAVIPDGGPYTITDGLPTDQDGTVYWQAVIWDAAGNRSPVYSGSIVLDTDGPQFVSAEVGSIDATSLIVTMSEALHGSTAAGDWTVLVDESPVTVSAAAISGSTADLTLPVTVTEGAAVTVAFAGTSLTDSRGNIADTFTAQAVTNNVAAPPAGPTPVQDILALTDTGSNVSDFETAEITIGTGSNRAVILAMPIIAAGASSDYSGTTATFGAPGRTFGTGTPMTIFGVYDPLTRRPRAVFAILVNPPSGVGTAQIQFATGVPAALSIAAWNARLYEYTDADQTIGNYSAVAVGNTSTTALNTSFTVLDGALLSVLSIIGGDVAHAPTITATNGAGDLITVATAGSTTLSDAVFAYATEAVAAGTDGTGFAWTTADEAIMATLNIPRA